MSFLPPLQTLVALSAIRKLEFRPERSRPIWRNRHTGTEVVVKDLDVDEHGGFQGGCVRFVVITNEPPPPGPICVRGWDGQRYSLQTFLEHWEPTGKYVEYDEFNFS